MSDEDIQISRRKAETPLERFMLVIAQARAGTFGLHYCRDDDEINAAAQKGKKITNKLRVGDVIYCEFREVKGSWTITRNNDPFVAVVDGTGQGAIPIDLLGGRRHNDCAAGSPTSALHLLNVVVWFRDGAPCS